MSKRLLKLGTRGSRLALWQANWVKTRLENVNRNLFVEIVPISTRGDRDTSLPLGALGGSGVFVKEIERALQKGLVDFAVHSAKDLPSELPADFELVAITAREDPRDVLLSSRAVTLEKLPAGAHLATGSPRRKAQLLHYRPDLHLEPLRGNLDTRIRKMQQADWTGIVAAWAGVKRLGALPFIADFIPLEICLPAAGQGALAVEILRKRSEIGVLLHTLSEPQTEAAVRAERCFLKTVGAGCHHPVGVLGQVLGEKIRLQAVIATADGSRVLRQEAVGSRAFPEEVGTLLARQMLDSGAETILRNSNGGL